MHHARQKKIEAAITLKSRSPYEILFIQTLVKYRSGCKRHVGSQGNWRGHPAIAALPAAVAGIPPDPQNKRSGFEKERSVKRLPFG